MPVLDSVLTALRISDADENIQNETDDLISAAIADLRFAGVNIPDDFEWNTGVPPLLLHAIILFCKAHFGYSEDSEKYSKAYEHIKSALALAGDDFSCIAQNY